MTLTPDEILNHEFTRKGSRAYVAREVDSFLDAVNNDYRTILADYEQQVARNQELQARIDELESQREQVNESIIFAQDAASRLRKETEADVKQRLDQAQREAQATLDQAHRDAEAETARLAQANTDLIAEQNQLRGQVDQFKQAFLAMIDQQKQLLSQDNLAAAVRLLPASELSQQVFNDQAQYEQKSEQTANRSLPTDLEEVPDFAKGPIEQQDEGEAAAKAADEKLAAEAKQAQAEDDPTVVVFPDYDENN
ncbi:DivIVA domain-containing protein [Leuconostocaceae bacterium ESL0958]|nr:DivIVA domain-containing protein [Leuconostocaceae bacterium ESL0958]